MAWRQSPGGSEQHLTLAAAAARTRTQRPGKHLAVHASKLVVKPDLQILRRYRRPLLLRLEHAHRSALEDHVHRASRVGQRRLLNVRIGISHTVQSGKSPPHLMAEVLLQFSGVLHFLSRAVASITLSSSCAATYSPL